MKRKISLLAACTAMLFHGVSVAQNGPVKNVGNVSSVTISGQKVTMKTDAANVEVTVYSPGIVRVRMDKQTLADDFSYGVVAAPEKTNTNITQDGSSVTIITDSLKTIISKSPFSVAFYTLDGKMINGDEKGLTTSWIGDQVTTYKHLQDGERFVGLGEKTGNLDRRGNGYTNWNSDNFGYSINQDPLYSTIPFYIGIHHDLNYGIFFDNTYQSDFNFGASNDRFSSFGARGGEMNYYFIYNTHVADIITSYTFLTGRMHMPPLWSLGYQQNRYSYYPETEVLRIAQTLREKKIPADGITLDIHYMDAYKLFTWNKQRFPDPKEMTDKLKAMGFKITVIVDPGIKVEKGYSVFERGVKDDVFLKYSDGEYYTGQVWPGWCHFPDFTSKKGRSWWRSEIKKYGGDGVSGIWNDMNEIATWGQKMPDNVIFDYDGHPTTSMQGHNVFGMNMARASFDGFREALDNKRPFILTRAGYAGLQRYTAIWTGDNRAEDDHMLAGVRLLGSLGLSGVSFTGMDIGGFTGNPSVNLFARWMEIGAFTPYFRNHTAVNTPSAEPWTHGEEVLEISRNYVNLRYRLLPYLYSTFYESSQDGLPVVRSLAIDYTHDDKVYDPQYQNQYLFGQSFMIVPFTGSASFGKVYLPAGKWYNLYTDELQQGGSEQTLQLALNKLPVYVKGGSIIPMESLVQTTAEQPTDTLTIHIYKGDAANTFRYYEDDGASYNYEHGDFYKRDIKYDPSNHAVVFDKAEGSFASKFKNLKVVFHGFDGNPSFKAGGKDLNAKREFMSLLTPISTFDPQGSKNAPEGFNVYSVVVKNENKDFSISY
jgi:alpha-glucosidase